MHLLEQYLKYIFPLKSNTFSQLYKVLKLEKQKDLYFFVFSLDKTGASALPTVNNQEKLSKGLLR